MPLPKSREWLDRLLEGHELSDAELRQLVEDCPCEDQWIEYKAGAVLGQDDPAALIREYIAGFANGDGGALVVGYRAGGSHIRRGACPRRRWFEGLGLASSHADTHGLHATEAAIRHDADRRRGSAARVGWPCPHAGC